MTSVEHYREAERLIERAAEWMDADYGFRASLGTDDRIARRTADLAEAQVHATLALAAATALTGSVAAHFYDEQPDLVAWAKAAGVNVDG